MSKRDENSDSLPSEEYVTRQGNVLLRRFCESYPTVLFFFSLRHVCALSDPNKDALTTLVFGAAIMCIGLIIIPFLSICLLICNGRRPPPKPQPKPAESSPPPPPKEEEDNVFKMDSEEQVAQDSETFHFPEANKKLTSYSS